MYGSRVSQSCPSSDATLFNIDFKVLSNLSTSPSVFGRYGVVQTERLRGSGPTVSIAILSKGSFMTGKEINGTRWYVSNFLTFWTAMAVGIHIMKQ